MLLEEENLQLRNQVQQLQKELSLKDALIATLELQVKNLIQDGSNGGELSKGPRKGSQSTKPAPPRPPGLPKAPNHPGTPLTRSSDDHDDDDHDDESTLPPQTSRRPSLDPPTRSEVEMASPLPLPKQSVLAASTATEEGKVVPVVAGEKKLEDLQIGGGGVVVVMEDNSSEGSSGGGRRGLAKAMGAIKALPRELSIINSDDDDVTKYSIDDNMPTYHLESTTEMRDAYNARGLYTGFVSRSQQMPHGRGRMKYHHQGRSYEGDWVYGHWHGIGRIQNANGDIFEGQVQNDLREGKGRLFYVDGRIFDGIFKDDDPVHGTLSFPDGARYVGELHNGARHGYGIYYFTDGSRYEGHSAMNIFEGKGKMTWTDGGWYEGEWRQGEIHGVGKEIRGDGSLRHKGQWSKGVPVRL